MTPPNREVALLALPTSMLHDMAMGLVHEMGLGHDHCRAGLEAVVDELAERATKGERPRGPEMTDLEHHAAR